VCIFSKVRVDGHFHSEYTRALTFENVVSRLIALNGCYVSTAVWRHSRLSSCAPDALSVTTALTTVGAGAQGAAGGKVRRLVLDGRLTRHVRSELVVLARHVF
jgi:hypothetical protein